MSLLYLDAAATTPVRREALEAAWPFLTGDFGNASSVHRLGLRAAEALAQARSRVAAVLGCRSGEVTFTSGGTEGDNLAVIGIATAVPRGRHLVTAAIEHEAVLESADYLHRVHGFEVDLVPLEASGRVTPEALSSVLRADTTLVSIALANNEIGTVQPIRELASVAHRVGARFHTDAVQATGRLALDVRALGVDALSLAGHKAGAPKGSGMVYLRGGMPVEPLVHGGGQERGRRSGTENVAFAVALSTALEAAAREQASLGPRFCADPARDAFIGRVLKAVPGAALTGDPVQRTPAHASFVIGGVNGETVLQELELRGVIASSGSACAAGRNQPSHVLTALGFPAELATTALRFTWGQISVAELERAAGLLAESVAAVRAISA